MSMVGEAGERRPSETEIVWNNHDIDLLTPKLIWGENEGGRGAKDGKWRDVSDKVELRSLGSTFQFCDNSW